MSDTDNSNGFELHGRNKDLAETKTQGNNEKAILLDKIHKVSATTAVKLRCAAIVISWLSCALTLILGITAVVFAAVYVSQSLFSFGLDSVLDCVSSVIILWRFYDKDIYSTRKELRACIMIGTLFVLSGILLATRCIVALLSVTRLQRPYVVLILACVNAFFCLVLGSSKVYLGTQLESRALVTDSIITFTGAVMSLFTLLFSAIYNHNKRLWYLDDSFGIICSIFLFCYGLRVIVVSRLDLKSQKEQTSS